MISASSSTSSTTYYTCLPCSGGRVGSTVYCPFISYQPPTPSTLTPEAAEHTNVVDLTSEFPPSPSSVPRNRKQMATATPAAKLELKPPPYPLDALEPHMSANTMSYHWGKHHRSYVDNLNKQILGTELQGKSLEDVIVQTYNNGDLHPAFNNAAQVWNHDFFWDSMKPGGGGKPSGLLLKLIERDFGSFEKFAEEFRAAAATQFGSGWAWLAFNPRPSDGKELVVLKTPNAVNPLVLGYTALLTIDVWEHAYYLDYQNRRPDYISIFMEKLVSWDAVSAKLEVARAQTFINQLSRVMLFY